jgi:hypothetical protein
MSLVTLPYLYNAGTSDAAANIHSQLVVPCDQDIVVEPEVPVFLEPEVSSKPEPELHVDVCELVIVVALLPKQNALSKTACDVVVLLTVIESEVAFAEFEL